METICHNQLLFEPFLYSAIIGENHFGVLVQANHVQITGANNFKLLPAG